LPRLDYLDQETFKPKNDPIRTDTSVGGGDLEAGASIVNAIFNGESSEGHIDPKLPAQSDLPHVTRSDT
jgi:hypothetical protein